MRLNDPASTATSSWLLNRTSGTSRFPVETASAIRESRRIGRRIENQRSTFRSTRIRRNTPTRETSIARCAWDARWSGTDIGTETICAPMISWSFQPYPPEMP